VNYWLIESESCKTKSQDIKTITDWVIIMKISELEVNQKNVNVEAEVLEVSPIREFTKFGNPGKVASALITDGTAQIQLTLWNEQTGMVKKGDKVKISNAYVKEWRGEKQLNVSRQGSLEVLS
jgi:replication factor A1